MRDRYLTAGLILETVLAVLRYAGWISHLQFLAATAILVIGAGLYLLFNYEFMSSFTQEINQGQNSSSDIIGQIDLQKIEGTLDDFSENQYPTDSMDIRWDLADYDVKKLDKWDEALVCVTGVLGQNNRKIQVFLQIPAYTPVGHKRIRGGAHQEKYPFRYSDYYLEYKRSSQSFTADDLKEMNRGGLYTGPYMAPNSRMRRRRKRDDNGSGGEDS